MSLTNRTKQVITVLNLVAVGIIFAYAARDWALPVIAQFTYKQSYKELMFKCDNVMRDHFIAKRQLLLGPSPEAIANLHAAEVGLIDCHDYDRLRKRLISLGLSENDLATWGLEAIEKHAQDVRIFVETHEFRY